MLVYQKQVKKGSLSLKTVTLCQPSPTHWLWHPETQQWQPAETLPFEAVHGLMLGYSVFTTFRTPQSPCWLRVHLQRVAQHAKAIALSPFAPINPAFESLSPILEANPSAVFRLTAVLAGDASLLQKNRGESSLPTAWLLHRRTAGVEPFPNAPQAPHLRLKTVDFQQALPQLKHGSLLPAWWVRRQALQADALVDEVVWQSPKGELLETTVGNLFCFMADGSIRTAEEALVLGGVTRQQVKKVCQRMGSPIVERAVGWAVEAPQVVGAFTSNSVRGLVAVACINGVPLPWDEKTLAKWHTLYTAWLDSLGLAGCYIG
jgi:branched-subunit amino acid aminotransferase/4-amino-4-deoxychorismate lyase